MAATSASYDLHSKKNVYSRKRVREYVVLRTLERELDWFILREEGYERLEPDSKGIYRSQVFPGLWLDAPALVQGDLASVLKVLGEGLSSSEHAEFLARLGPI